MQIKFQPTLTGAIVFDARLFSQAEDAWFEPSYWQTRGAVIGHSAGRGRVWFVRTPFGECALRHYHRGGMVARILSDRYLWSGAERTRSLREFRLLADLHALGLPVPAPLAARYVRSGMQYRADLLTERLPNCETLAQKLAAGQLDDALAANIGAVIAVFHAHGVFHADMNAHNFLIDDKIKVWLIDFDRGERRGPELSWRHANLERLKRSLLKLGDRVYDNAFFECTVWRSLMTAYEQGFNEMTQTSVNVALPNGGQP